MCGCEVLHPLVNFLIIALDVNKDQYLSIVFVPKKTMLYNKIAMTISWTTLCRMALKQHLAERQSEEWHSTTY